MFKPLLFLALGYAVATPASAAPCDWRPGQRIDLDCAPTIDLLTDAVLRRDHAPVVKDVLAHAGMPFIQGYVAGLRDQLRVSDYAGDAAGKGQVYLFEFGNKACVPLDLQITAKTLIDAVREYLARPDADPGYEALSFAVALPAALIKAYPCPESLR